MTRKMLVQLLLLLLWTSLSVQALRFDMIAKPYNTGSEKCLIQWIPKNTLVMVTINSKPVANQRADVQVYDSSEHRNEYAKKLDVTETKIAFTTQAHADVSVCIQNHLADGITPSDSYIRSFEVSVDVGADAVDYGSMAKEEKLKPMEVELRRLERLTEEVLADMEYLRQREQEMRDTNESTNDRVRWFNLISIISLLGLGVYQVVYLKQFFQSKKLI